ncbi:squamosa promoter-binding-like protein 1 [Impatiens glandulifera]|uniref:squamosa promoter-binding-like protein 1 n=1 Tax=Impatiens glandulifera TaxID=253017 RepID=UPI001FB12136|nr:squamosa promoter-binding-like protein 1 [Impatiens glandulifera]XP_047315632.1 squamosa promoter-binding-like protein 1 [Impatiens glandulifera]
MEAQSGGNSHHLYGPVLSEIQGFGKKRMEWDLNDWKWDGDLFLATPINPLPADCRSGQLFPLLPEDTTPENEREKRRRDVIVSDESRSLNLNLGCQTYPVITESAAAEIEKSEGKSGKKSKIFPAIPIRSVCQVEDCRADLSHAKDYHRRHKVCDVHSKASKALIGNVMQRFCQQCSRFHILDEFDEGRRSCRRRLAGHNRRRRKTHPETVANNGSSLNNEHGSSYLLISLLRILSNMHTNNSEELKDQDVLTHLLRNLANPGGVTMPARDLGAPTTTVSPRPGGGDDDGVHDVSMKKKKNFDLNNAYDDSEGCNENFGNQTISNSASTSSQSPSSSSGDAQSRTDRIVFKLFGKDPSNFPLALRKQILDWLSNSPTDIESYIRPGCIILTIYLRLGNSAWDELSSDLSSSLLKLIDASNDSFWKSGWVYTRLQHHVAFVYNGRIVLDTPLPFESRNCGISSIRPIAVPPSRKAQFVVKGFNMSCSTLRLLCAFEGRYLAEENGSNSTEESDGLMTTADEVQCISLSCSIPNMNGRGFIEVEDHGLSSSFFPFIVAEQDVCSEICTLEAEIESTCTKNQAIDFIHEMGWLLHRFVNTEMGGGANLFPFERFKQLVEFSIDRDWCFVVKKLLGILYKGCVDIGEHSSSIEAAVSEMSLLHRAVQRNSAPMVVFLLRYVADGLKPEFLFRPDAVGPGGLTPLHVAASRKGNESVLDALTDDPHSVGIEAWNTARDGTGMTPNDYACMRGYYSHVHLVQRKINRLHHHVTLDIPNSQMACLNTEKIETKQKDFGRGNCRMCRKTPATYGRSTVSSVALYRPAMLSMVAIAAVCVCVALLFKSCPQVMYVFGPFRWELLKYGSS